MTNQTGTRLIVMNSMTSIRNPLVWHIPRIRPQKRQLLCDDWRMGGFRQVDRTG